MGLGDIVPDKAEKNKYRQYPDHELQDELEEVVEESKELFPGGVDVAFIEVSPQMTSTQGYCYYKPECSYIRIAEDVVENDPWEYIESIIRHEMVHAWMKENGWADVSDGSRVFEWVLGRVEADISGMSYKSPRYEIIEEFKNHDKEIGE